MATSLEGALSGLFSQVYGQPLDEWIKDRRDEGMSWRQCAIALRDLTDATVDVAPQTLHNWTDGYTPTDTAAA